MVAWSLELGMTLAEVFFENQVLQHLLQTVVSDFLKYLLWANLAEEAKFPALELLHVSLRLR